MANSRIIQSIGIRLSDWCERWIPNSFTIAILLTLITAICVVIVRPDNLSNESTPEILSTLLEAWGNEFTGLLEPAMQMALVILSGYIIANAQFSIRFIERLAKRFTSPKRAIAFAAAFSMITCFIHWGFGLLISASMARALAINFHTKGIKIDYRLLVAASYLGMGTTWHAGFSGSATLCQATPKSKFTDAFGVVGFPETVFSSFNLSLSINF